MYVSESVWAEGDGTVTGMKSACVTSKGDIGT